ncbi:MAG: hypothetical protein R3293_23255 [Candidatus Promineifilaceae bacterium]|nr:hypothetical protein [Candidatus Promineifilaceae bacterium]
MGPLITLSLAMFIIVIDTTIMNVSISVLVVDLNTTIPNELETQLNEEIEDGVTLVSDTVFEDALTDANVPEAISNELEQIYALARTESFRAAPGMLVLFWPGRTSPVFEAA